MSFVLSLRNFCLSFGSRITLHRVNFDMPRRGVVGLMGPGGAGKTTLLRTLAGLTSASANITGEATYRGLELGQSEHPALVTPKLHFMTSTLFEFLRSNLRDRSSLTKLEQRRALENALTAHCLTSLVRQLDVAMFDLSRVDRRLAAIIREVLPSPPLLLLDEPTNELDDSESDLVLQLIERQGTQRAVVFVTHNQTHARRVCQHVALIAAGQLLEYSPVEVFFASPKTRAVREYVRTGGCSRPSLNARPEELEPSDTDRLSANAQTASKLLRQPATDTSVSSQPSGEYIPARRGPNGFHWLIPGKLAGTARPGLLVALDQDLEALTRCRVTWFVDLTEVALPESDLKRHGIQLIHFPVVDMDVPALTAAWNIVTRVERLVGYGEVVTYGCKAGLGRTGTLLCCHLVYAGSSGPDAVKAARRIHKSWVQSSRQLDFIDEFAILCRNCERAASTRQPSRGKKRAPAPFNSINTETKCR